MKRVGMMVRLGPLVLMALLSACGAGLRGERPVLGAPKPERANEVLIRALGLVGTPYVYGGNTPEGGFDCSGLVDFVFLDAAGVALPRTTQELARVDAPEVPQDELASGDLVLFSDRGRISHVGIYVGEGRFVHAPRTGGTVRLDQLDGPYWREHFAGARRVL